MVCAMGLGPLSRALLVYTGVALIFSQVAGTRANFVNVDQLSSSSWENGNGATNANSSSAQLCRLMSDVEAPQCNAHFAQPSCKLMADTMGKLLQLVLAGLGLLSLLIKKKIQESSQVLGIEERLEYEYAQQSARNIIPLQQVVSPPTGDLGDTEARVSRVSFSEGTKEAAVGLSRGRAGATSTPDHVFDRSEIPQMALDEAKRTNVFRPYKVWALDVSKQAMSGICAHFAGMFNAKLLDDNDSNSDQCSWYFISFTLDTTIGVAFSYVLFALTTSLAKRWGCVSLERSGDYHDVDGNVNPWIWGKQMGVWCIITIVARFTVLGCMLLVFDGLSVVADAIARWFACYPHLLLMLVMVCCPVLMNVGMLWVQDQFLMAKQESLEEAARRIRRTSLRRSSLLLGPRGSLGTSLIDASRSNREMEEVAKPQTFRDLQKQCCCVSLGVFSILLFFASVAGLTVVAVNERDYTDHCYSHVYSHAWKIQLQEPDHFNDHYFQRYRYNNSGRWGGHAPLVANCSAKDYVAGDKASTSLRNVLRRRRDLHWMDESQGSWMTGTAKCMCCTQAVKPRLGWNATCHDHDTSHGDQIGRPMDCDGAVGTCCKKPSLHNTDEKLLADCMTCPIYLPCDGKYCAARPEYMRNAQHIPMFVGVMLSLISNVYVLKTYWFDSKLRRPTITTLLAWAALVQLIFCVALVAQEASFRFPIKPCLPTQDVNKDGHLSDVDCEPSESSSWHGWPTWENVIHAANSERTSREKISCYHRIKEMSDMHVWYAPESNIVDLQKECNRTLNDVTPSEADFHVNNETCCTEEMVLELKNHLKDKTRPLHHPGQRGAAINGCKTMSFIFQLTFTASDSFYFMITIDLLLNLFASPFGGSRKRMMFYQGWTWLVSGLLAVLLIISGDWGVSSPVYTEKGAHTDPDGGLDTPGSSTFNVAYDKGGSILEDFCWNVNFGHKHESNSNWPALTWVIYGTSLGYYSLSFLVALGVYFRLKSLTRGQREARSDTINTGWLVVGVITAWMLVYLIFYYFVVLEQSFDIVKVISMRIGTLDYRSPDQKKLVVVWSFMLGARGTVNWIIWRFVVMPRYNARAKRVLGMNLRNARQARSAHSEHVDELNEILMHEVLFFTGLGIRSALRCPDDEHAHERTEAPNTGDELLSNRFGSRDAGSRARNSRATSRTAQPRVSSASDGSIHRGTVFESDDDFADQLTPRTRRRLNDSMNSRSVSIETEKLGEEDIDVPLLQADYHERTCNEGGKSPFCRNMDKMFGQEVGFYAADGQEVQEHQRTETQLERQSRQQYERTKHLSQFKFRSYRVNRFRELRELFGLENPSAKGCEGLLHKAMSQYKTGSFHGGSSNSFMYYSEDKRFIVKQVSHRESKVFLDMLPDYINHMKKSIVDGILEEKRRRNSLVSTDTAALERELNRLRTLSIVDLRNEAKKHGTSTQVTSLLLRIVQCNRVKMYMPFDGIDRCNLFNGGRLYFIVTENIFHKYLTTELDQLRETQNLLANPHIFEEAHNSAVELAEKKLQRYDLKGSWVNRSTTADLHHSWHLTRKDNDLQEKIYMAEDEWKALDAQLKLDTEFLQEHGIMDYSMLLGIRKGLNRTQLATSQSSRATVGSDADPMAMGGKSVGSEAGSVYNAAAYDGPRRYYVGIIDILQEWTWQKRLERYAKALLGKDISGISAMEPLSYRRRFIHKMQQHFEPICPRRSGSQSLQSGMSPAALERLGQHLQLEAEQTQQLTSALTGVSADRLVEFLQGQLGEAPPPPRTP